MKRRQKIKFEAVDNVFEALMNAFNIHTVDFNNPNFIKFYLMWFLFLETAGWTQKEFETKLILNE